MILRRSFLTLFILSLITAQDGLSQGHARYQRRKERVERRINDADREGKLDHEEKEDIRKKEKKLNRSNRRAIRDGEIDNREQNKMDRRLRRVKRETRRSSRD